MCSMWLFKILIGSLFNFNVVHSGSDLDSVLSQLFYLFTTVQSRIMTKVNS